MAQNHGGHLENHLGGFAAVEARDVIERIFLDDSPFMILSPNRSIRIVSPAFFHDISGLMSGRRQYPFHLIEPKWQCHWDRQQTFRAWNPGETVPAEHPFAQRHPNTPPEKLPKFYILDMFPYPSGAGLHVGHPEG